jgi:hypothetical protein
MSAGWMTDWERRRDEGATRAPMAETDLFEAVRQAADLGGRRWFHTFDSRRSPAGFPDLVLARGPELLFVELKSASGHPTAEQTAWLQALRETGVRAEIWRPADLDRALSLLLARRPGGRASVEGLSSQVSGPLPGGRESGSQEVRAEGSER